MIFHSLSSSHEILTNKYFKKILRIIRNVEVVGSVVLTLLALEIRLVDELTYMRNQDRSEGMSFECEVRSFSLISTGSGKGLCSEWRRTPVGLFLKEKHEVLRKKLSVLDDPREIISALLDRAVGRDSSQLWLMNCRNYNSTESSRYRYYETMNYQLGFHLLPRPRFQFFVAQVDDLKAR